MTNLPPSRTADRIIVRLPDGMRDRLAARAKANGRSATAEVVAMLEQVLDGTSFTEFKAFHEEFQRLNRQYKSLSAAMQEINERRDAVAREMRAIAAQDATDAADPELKAMAERVISSMSKIIRPKPEDDTPR